MVRIINYSPNLYQRSQSPHRASDSGSNPNPNPNQTISFPNNPIFPVAGSILQQIEFRVPSPETRAAVSPPATSNVSPAPFMPMANQQIDARTPYFPDPAEQARERLRRRLMPHPENLNPDQIAHQQTEQARRRAEWSAQHNVVLSQDPQLDELLRVIEMQNQQIRRGQSPIKRHEGQLRQLENIDLPGFIHEDQTASDEQWTVQEEFDEVSNRPVRSRSASPRRADYQQPIRQRPTIYVETQFQWDDNFFGSDEDEDSSPELTDRDLPGEDLTAGWPEEDDEEVEEVVELDSQDEDQVTDAQLPPLYLQILQHSRRKHAPPDPASLAPPVQSPQPPPRTQALPQNPQPPATAARGRGRPQGNGRRIVAKPRSRSPAVTRSTVPRQPPRQATSQTQPDPEQQLRRSTRDRCPPSRLEAQSMAPPQRAPRPVAVRPNFRSRTPKQATAPKKTIIHLHPPKPPSTTPELTTGQGPERAAASTPDLQVLNSAPPVQTAPTFQTPPVNVPTRSSARVRIKKEPSAPPPPPPPPTAPPTSRPPSTLSNPYLYHGQIGIPPNPTASEIAVYRTSWQPGQALPERIPDHVFLCYSCGKRFCYKGDLRRHYKAVHAGEGLDVNAVFPHPVRTDRGLHYLVDANGVDLPESQQRWPATGQGTVRSRAIRELERRNG